MRAARAAKVCNTTTDRPWLTTSCNSRAIRARSSRTAMTCACSAARARNAITSARRVCRLTSHPATHITVQNASVNTKSPAALPRSATTVAAPINSAPATQASTPSRVVLTAATTAKVAIRPKNCTFGLCGSTARLAASNANAATLTNSGARLRNSSTSAAPAASPAARYPPASPLNASPSACASASTTRKASNR